METGRQRELALDTSKLESWEIAALLDALLAYPGAREERLRAIVTSRCAAQIRVTIEDNPSRRADLISRYPGYNPAKSRTSTKRIEEKRRNASRAGAVFLPFIQEVAAGSPPTLRGEIIVPTLDLLVPIYWPRRVGEDEEIYRVRMHDIEKREVRRRYPVAHLAAALQMLAQERHAAGGDDWYDYQDLPFLREWVSKACEIAGYMRATPKCEMMASRLIDLRWIEGEQVSAPGAEA